MSDQPVANASMTDSKQKERTSMPSARFEPAIPAIEGRKTDNWDCTASGIGVKNF